MLMSPSENTHRQKGDVQLKTVENDSDGAGLSFHIQNMTGVILLQSGRRHIETVGCDCPANLKKMHERQVVHGGEKALL